MSKGAHLAEFELLVMLAIAALAENAYGVSIATEINRRTGRDVAMGAVYATLGRLADKGYVTFSLSEPEPVRGGRARKLVTLTAAGLRALRLTTDSIARMLDGVALHPAGIRR
jgi:DNA-binding PadR family transcriptional regulator